MNKPTSEPSELKPGNLSSLSGLRPLYLLPEDNLAEEVLVPALRYAHSVDCMMGFFSSEAFSALAPGLASFVNHSNQTMRLLVSPFLRPEDRDAIEHGLRKPEDVIDAYFEELFITEELLHKHTLRCLSYLIRENRIEIKVALMKDGLFHPKVWIIGDGNEYLGVHGSSNLTQSGIKRNFEQVAVAMSWIDPTQKYVIEKLESQFNRLWDGKQDNCIVLDFSEALREKVLRDYRTDAPPTEQEFQSLYRQATCNEGEQEPEFHPPSFGIPSWLNFQSGPFEHQGHAVNAWCSEGYRGVLEMATGSGKTITAMICAHRLYETKESLLIVVAAPYIPLIEQWCDEIEPFGLSPINLTTVSGVQARNRLLQQVKRRLRLGNSTVEVLIVSHDTLCTKDLTDSLEAFDCPRLLIADEVHNLGRPGFINNPPEFFDHRLALSATPERQYDEEGTEALFKYFGPVVFKFTLEEAIGQCLVEYDYYVHPVHLSPDEMDEWYFLTDKIRQNAWRTENKKPDDYLAKLFRDRRLLLESAKEKINVLSELLDKEDLASLQHTLIYTSDKAPEQLNQVNSLLHEKGLLFHQLTAEETSNRSRCAEIIQSFQDGEIGILTAKRVLDEGVNIPQIDKAFILASTTVERQWVQRRGRLLRTCKATGKTYSIIHDFLTLPPSLNTVMDEDSKTLIKSELRRIQEFATLARNAGKPDGPLPIIDELVNLVSGP